MEGPLVEGPTGVAVPAPVEGPATEGREASSRRGAPAGAWTASERPTFAGDWSGGWGWLEAPGHSLSVPLPDAAAWRVVESGRWFVVRHEASGSTLSLRAWSARRTVTRAECDAELRLGRPELRNLDAGERLTEHSGVGPAGFDGLVAAFIPSPGRGVALALGAGQARCYAVVLQTSGAAEELGRRLAIATERILVHLRWRTVEEREGLGREALSW